MTTEVETRQPQQSKKNQDKGQTEDQEQPQAQAIVISGQPSIDGAITALRHGAVDFLTKPFTAKDLSERVGRALKRQAIVVKNGAYLTTRRNSNPKGP